MDEEEGRKKRKTELGNGDERDVMMVLLGRSI